MEGKREKTYYQIAMIDGGLGSQMAKYAFYILLKHKCPDRMNMIDTFYYHYAHSWNGYELNKIFGIDAPDLIECYENMDMEGNGYFEKAYHFFLKEQPDVPVIRVSRGEYTYYNCRWAALRKFRDKVLFKIRYEWEMHFDNRARQYGYYHDRYKKNCFRLKANVYFDEFNYTSDQYFREIKSEIKKAFTFPDFCDEKNDNCAKKMLETESVVMHIRRSDHMYDNGYLYEQHYYKKTVNFIRSKVSEPVFFLFSDEPEWCEENKEVLGLRETDDIVIVNWNKQEDSFRDMQLMTYGKHNILAISSFSWWGYYLSSRKDKIVCAPEGYWLEVNNHF